MPQAVEAKWKPGGRGRPPKWAKQGLTAPPSGVRAEPPAGVDPVPAGPAAAPGGSAGTPGGSGSAPGPGPGIPNPLRGAPPAGAAAGAPSSAAPAPAAKGPAIPPEQKQQLLVGLITPAIDASLDFLCAYAKRQPIPSEEVAEAHVPELALGTIQAWWPELDMDPRWLVTAALVGTVYVLVKRQPPVGAARENEAPVPPRPQPPEPRPPAAARAAPVLQLVRDPPAAPPPAPSEPTPASPEPEDEDALVPPKNLLEID